MKKYIAQHIIHRYIKYTKGGETRTSLPLAKTTCYMKNIVYIQPVYALHILAAYKRINIPPD
jgi:hypothetical protein